MKTFYAWLETVATAFDPLENHTKTGKYFHKFFSDVSAGRFGKSDVPYKEAIDFAHARPFHEQYQQHSGHFDDHIAKSIPTFREVQARKGHAIVAVFGQEPVSMLDIGGSEGSFAKTVTHMSGGKVTTKVLDPNPDMEQHFNKTTIPGSSYDRRAFIRGWVEDNGEEVPALNAANSPERFDIIHEAMVFQFINNQRTDQLTEAKKLLKPGGLLLTEEKLKTSPEEWQRNEIFKDQNHKNTFYSGAELAAKQKIVGFQQDEKENKVVGMVDNMVSPDEFETTLTHLFKEVWQYWDSGNFKGYVASDDAAKAKKFVMALGDLNNKFSTTKLPRRIIGSLHEGTMFDESEHSDLKKAMLEILPSEAKAEKMSRKHLKQEYGPKLKKLALADGVNLTDADIDDILKSFKAHDIELPEFDVAHYHHHM